jgi:hypothetical protein
MDEINIFENQYYHEFAAGVIVDDLSQRRFSKSSEIRRSFKERRINKTVFIRQLDPNEIALSQKYGYRILDFGEFNWEDFMNALRIFQSIHGHLNVPRGYIINERSTGFLEYKLHDLVGFHLGDGVESVRIGDVDALEDPERLRQLDELGFTWGDLSSHLRFRFVPLYLGLRVNFHLTDTSILDKEFVIPDWPTWPHWMVGMPLGKWAALAREQKETIETYYPERKVLLDSLTFPWYL